jgi:Pyruvate/2-oxoacid:ferredoxin oxidoreductase delta subunit
MAKIEIESHLCTVSLSKLSSCNNCITSCPTEAIFKLENGLINISERNCVECGVCSAFCPTEAIKLIKFSPIDKIFELIKSQNIVLDCKNGGIPCLASFSIEYLVSLIILKKSDIFANYSHCSSCSIFPKVGKYISLIIDEVNFLLQALNLPHQIKLINQNINHIEEKNSFDKSRRFFDGNIFDIKSGEVRELNYKSMRNKNIPAHRKLFLMAIKKLEVSKHILLSNDISTFSQKAIDLSCIGCQLCWRICPSGALFSNNIGSFIDFDSGLCLKCGLCHDVCENKSIYIKDEFSILKLFENRTDRLISLNMSRCDECSSLFVKKADNINNLCNRCEIEENEALSLWNL